MKNTLENRTPRYETFAALGKDVVYQARNVLGGLMKVLLFVLLGAVVFLVLTGLFLDPVVRQFASLDSETKNLVMVTLCFALLAGFVAKRLVYGVSRRGFQPGSAPKATVSMLTESPSAKAAEPYNGTSDSLIGARFYPGEYAVWVDHTLPAGADREAYAVEHYEQWERRHRVTWVQTCAHESAHALVAHVMGATILTVDMRRRPVPLSTAVFEATVYTRYAAPDAPAGESLYNGLRVHLAGLAQDSIMDHTLDGAQSDIKAAQVSAAQLAAVDPSMSPDAHFAAASREARQILDQHQDAISAMSEMLKVGEVYEGQVFHDIFNDLGIAHGYHAGRDSRPLAFDHSL